MILIRHQCGDPYSGECDCLPLVLSQDEFERLLEWLKSDDYRRTLEDILSSFYDTESVLFVRAKPMV